MTTPRLAVLGSGLMGIGIAVHLARHGHAVRLQDVDPARLAEVAATVRTLLAELEEADIAVDTEAVAARLTTTTELADLADCDLLFEAVPERLELKHRLYAQLEAVLRPDALIASNTSGLPPDELAAHLRHPERLLIAHFWNPPHFIPLVELVPGTDTLPTHLESVRQLLEAADLEAVVLQRAIPGFVGNRLQFALLREALHIVQSGAADAETVDRVMRASLGRRYAMVGPLEAADMGGLDTFRDIASHLWPTLARDEAPLQLLEDQVAAGRTGVRSGAGFYDWDAARRERIVQRRLHQLRHALKP